MSAQERDLHERQITAAKTQSLYREVNDRIEELPRSSDVVKLGCECTLEDCEEHVSMTDDEYEELRTKPRRFAVAPGHYVEDVERVVGEHDRYSVVEKIGAGGPIAERFDPRSRPRRPS